MFFFQKEMIHRNGSEVESVRSNNGFETARNKSAENLRNLSQVSPLGMSKNNRKYSPGLSGPSAQTFISANDHIRYKFNPKFKKIHRFQ